MRSRPPHCGAVGQDVTKLIEVPKVSIPVMRLTAPGSWKNKTGKIQLRSGKLTGIHAGNGNMLVQWDGRSAGRARRLWE